MELNSGRGGAGLRQSWRALWALVCGVVLAATLSACGGGGDSNASAAGSAGERLAVAAVETPVSLGLKVLVISADGTQPSFQAIKATLDQIGVPYDTLIASTTPLTAAMLSDGAGNGKYQGVILETGSLVHLTAGGTYDSALTAAQWQILWDYERNFGVRQATLYTYPGTVPESYGLNYASVVDTSVTALTASFTTAGQQVFGYLNTATPLTVRYAYAYPSTPVGTTETVPLLTTQDGNVIAALHTAPDGRENLAFTVDHNPDLMHTLLTGYGVVNWVTKGVFMGERKVYLSAQPDDVFLPDDIWDPATLSICGDPIPSIAPSRVRVKPCEYRMTGYDYNQLIAWQNALQSKPNAAQIRLEHPFNGSGYNQAMANDVPDTLTGAVLANRNAFRWISHTWDHENLDAASASLVTSQLSQNHSLAVSLGFTDYFLDSFIQPDISGLENRNFYAAAQAFGLRNILMDTSRTYSFRPTLSAIPPNTGFTSALDTGNPKIFIIPRYPTSLYYNVSTPEEWLSEYNYFYAPGGLFPTWDHRFNYAELLNVESDTLVRYMLKFHANSWMFHQPNLRAYPVDANGNPAPYPYTGASPGTRSTLGDLIDAVVNKYNSLYNLPIQNLSQHEIAALMQARTQYNAAVAGGLKGRIVYGATPFIELTNASGVAVTVPMTGVDVGGTVYGGQAVSSVPLAAGATTTFPLTASAPRADLAIVKTASTTTVPAGGTLSFSLVISNAGPATATAATFADTLPVGLGTLTGVVSQASAGASTATFSNTGSSLSGAVTLPAGGQVTVTFQVGVSRTAPGSMINVATVAAPAGTVDPVAANNSSSVALNLASADVTAVLDLPARAPAGSAVTGTVTFANSATGPSALTATAVVGTVTLSSGDVRSFALGDLAPGARSVQTFTTIVPSTTASTALNGTATVATATPESSTANNQGTDTLAVLFADAGVVVNAIPAAALGNTVTTTLTLSNSGSATVTFTPLVVVNGVTTTLAPVTLAPAGTVRTAPISVLVTATGSTVTGIVTAQSVTDRNAANDSATRTGTVWLPDVRTTVNLPTRAVGGTVVTVSATFRNASSLASAASVTGTVVLSNGDTRTYALGNLAPGATVTRSFTTTTPLRAVATTLVATSTVATTSVESNAANNTATDTMNVR